MISKSPSTPADKPIPVTVLTGFLGSGKTTLLNGLMRHDALARTLVIINEFGDIGLDHALLVHTSEDVVVEMSSGCLCCTIRGDLAKTLRDAPWRFAREGKRWFDRVIIETTGLADPIPILHTLMMSPGLGRYRLDGVIVTVDAATGMETLARQIESVKQAAVADRLLLTKTDLADREGIAALTARLRAINPSAPIIAVRDGAAAPEDLLEAGLFNPDSKIPDVRRWLNSERVFGRDEHHDHHHDINRHDSQIGAICVAIDEPIAPDLFNFWLEMVAAYRGPDLLRIKGIVNLVGASGPVVIHGVQHIFHPSVTLDAWPDDDRRSRIVFIGRNLPEKEFRQAFDILAGATAH